VLLLRDGGWAGWGTVKPHDLAPESGARYGRGYSAATTTTATARDAAQVDCASLGERRLEAG
jgi:hypothetical protein